MLNVIEKKLIIQKVVFRKMALRPPPFFAPLSMGPSSSASFFRTALGSFKTSFEENAIPLTLPARFSRDKHSIVL